MLPRPKKIVLLGATGSIGESTLRVVRKHPERLQLVGIAGHSKSRELAAIAHEFGVEDVVVYDEGACEKAIREQHFSKDVRLSCGMEGLIGLASQAGSDLVVTAVVGTLSLKPTLAAIEAGKDIALASKEILVLAGSFVMEAARRKGVQVLPLDSEHNAIFQCLQGAGHQHIAKLILTASGGPFRNYTAAQMQEIRLEDALNHPNWEMGRKITIDSSTMANKGLELIEARWLFDTEPERIEVVVHPQSIVHSMVQFIDGSILAQLSPPSMTFAIQHTLLYPERAEGVEPTLDFTKMLQLEFQPPDFSRFPCLRLAIESMKTNGVAPATFNAANEVAVAAFLKRQISYLDIPRIIEETLSRVTNQFPADLETVLQKDAEARATATGLLQPA